MIYNKEYFDSTIQSFLISHEFIEHKTIRINEKIYHFEDWMLPQKGKILVQQIESNKDSFFNKLDVKSTEANLLFDVDLYPNRLVVKVTLDPIHLLKTVVFIYENNYLIEVSGINSRELVTTLKINIGHYPSFELHSDCIVFIKYAKNGRPNEIWTKKFGQSNENSYYFESRVNHQVKLIKTSLPNRTLFKNNLEYLLFTSSEKVPIQTIWHKKYGKVDHVTDFVINSKEYLLFVRKKSNLVDHELILYSCNDKRYQIISTKKSLQIFDIEANHTYILIRYFDSNYLKSGIIPIEHLISTSKDFIKEVYDLPLKGEVHFYSDYTEEKSTYLSYQDECVSQFLYRYNSLEQDPLTLIHSSTTIPKLNTKLFQHVTCYVASFNDGIKIPLTIYWKGTSNNLPYQQPGIIYVYGAYGTREQKGNLDPMMIAMIELGFVYCVAHVRGGGYLGRRWHEAGKYLNKWHSIHDFLDCCHYLVDKKIVDKNKLSLISSSAGGIIAGMSLNEEPNLFKSMLLASPFVDPYNTMLYKRDYLSHMEVSEWGDPAIDSIVREYIHSYSPLQNTEKVKESNTKLFVVCGENDKKISNDDVRMWLEKLQKVGINSQFYINKRAGHGGLEKGDISSMTKILSDFLGSIFLS